MIRFLLSSNYESCYQMVTALSSWGLIKLRIIRSDKKRIIFDLNYVLAQYHRKSFFIKIKIKTKNFSYEYRNNSSSRTASRSGSRSGSISGRSIRSHLSGLASSRGSRSNDSGESRPLLRSQPEKTSSVISNDHFYDFSLEACPGVRLHLLEIWQA